MVEERDTEKPRCEQTIRGNRKQSTGAPDAHAVRGHHLTAASDAQLATANPSDTHQLRS